MSLRAVIEGTGLTLSACASTIGVDFEVFQQWADAKREMPPTYASVLAAVLGVKPEVLTSRHLTASKSISRVEPSAIWFKFRGREFTDRDRESILSVRRLGHNANQLELATDGTANRQWSTLFKDVLDAVDLQASPQAQGRAAAQAFAGFTQFGHGGTGSSEIMRGNLRAKGILIIESPIPKSHIEGCSFLVGDSTTQRPCIFVNAYMSTWFRRNMVIMHELGHAIFDQNSGVEIDIRGDGDIERSKGLPEIRAESFARECLLPRNLLLSFCSQNGVKPTTLTERSLAAFVAFSGVEKKTVIEILRDNELIDDALASKYQAYDIASALREQTDHALSTSEYIDKIGLDLANSWLNKRFSTATPSKLLLPVTYVKAVIEAVRAFKISLGKAAELLMIDMDTFNSRFSDVVLEVSE